MTAPQPGPGRYRPPTYRPPTDRPPHQTYGASVDDGVRQLHRRTDSPIAASPISETERIHRMLLRHYAAPHSSPLRDHGRSR